MSLLIIKDFLAFVTIVLTCNISWFNSGGLVEEMIMSVLFSLICRAFDIIDELISLYAGVFCD